jgi:hypothetical protein
LGLSSEQQMHFCEVKAELFKAPRVTKKKNTSSKFGDYGTVKLESGADFSVRLWTQCWRHKATTSNVVR